MVTLFGQTFTKKELGRLFPDLMQVAGFKAVTVEDGAGRGTRLLQVDSGGGLRIDLLPDRCCDIGQVWCDNIPFGWINPMGTPAHYAIGENNPLSGLMSTCGFDHIRQPEKDNGRSFPLHGNMTHMPARIIATDTIWDGDECMFRVKAEVTQFNLNYGGVRLRRHIYVPLGGQSLIVSDRVVVVSGELPVMAMYHINLGFPLVTPRSTLSFDGQDITEDCLAQNDIKTRPSGTAISEAVLRASPESGAQFRLKYDGSELPFLQTLRNDQEGINLFCLEPATHDRLSRRQMREAGDLVATPPGATHTFRIEMLFESGR
ncbi:DUF4432 family protein [Pseudorhizobium pelagicum]|uniref:DUF4432 family protein n=1 Tax=Pseudorhizobium pelagicum TaxID=1509405 RepID=UPI0004DA02BE|nr:DUF4432 family protein [Pseudorhizobium pelagicum]KEQ02634.1 hypothetical protein GV67_18895 [Pseudorhizobium pelagicum]